MKKTIAALAAFVAALALADTTVPVKTYVNYTNRVHGLPAVRIGQITWPNGQVQTNFVYIAPNTVTPKSNFSVGEQLSLKDIVTGSIQNVCVSNGVLIVR